MKALVQRIFWLLTVILIPTLVLMGPAPAPAQAADTYWKNGNQGDWFTADNWDQGIPSATTDAHIGYGSVDIGAGQSAYAQFLYLGTVSDKWAELTLYGSSSLNVGSFLVGNSRNASFNQIGGSTTVTNSNRGLVLGDQTGSEGYYYLFNGNLSAQTETIGNAGKGYFQQKSGTINTVALGMNLGSMSGGEGQYILEGGSLSFGSGAFFYIGCGPGGTGTFLQTGGNLSASNLHVGSLGTGTFTQTGGTNTLSGPNGLMLGTQTGSVGTYNLEGGILTTTQEAIGIKGTGTFIQSGGTHTLSGQLVLGVQSGSHGDFRLIGGSLDAQNLVVGNQGYGKFVQKAGTTLTVANYLILGQFAGSEGWYTLEDGSLSLRGAGASLNVGAVGTGTFTQKGGSLSLGGNVTVGGANSYGYFFQSGGTVTNTRTDAFGRVMVGFNDGSQGRYELSAGRLTADRVIVGYSDTANNQQGSGQGTLTVSGGRLEARALLVGNANTGSGFGKLDLANASAEVVVSEILKFGAQGQFTAVPGATIHMTGSEFQNTSQSSTNLAGLSNLTLSFEHINYYDPFEVAGTDKGASLPGFTNNFVLGNLKLGANSWLQLVNASDNNGVTNDFEALYVCNLELGSGAKLDLNGLHLYYQHLTDNGGSFENGSPQQVVPVPGTLLLLGSGLLGLVSLRRFRKS